MAPNSSKASVSSFELNTGKRWHKTLSRIIPTAQMSMAIYEMKSDVPFHQIKLCDTHQRSDRDISTRPLALETLLFPLDSPVHQVCVDVTRFS